MIQVEKAPEAKNLNPGEISAQMKQKGYGPFAFPLPPRMEKDEKAEFEELLWMARGSLHLTTSSQTIELKAGDKALIPKNSQYRLTVTDPTGCYYLLGRK